MLERLPLSRGAFGAVCERSGLVRWPEAPPKNGDLGSFSGLAECTEALKKKGIDVGIPLLSVIVGDDCAAWVPDPKAALEFLGGEMSGLERVRQYVWGERGTGESCSNLEEYFDVRNGLLGKDFSSKWSPWLAFGCLSPRWCHWEIVRWERGNDYMKKHAAHYSHDNYLWWQGGEEGQQGMGERKGSYWMIFELESRDYMHYMGIKYEQTLFDSGYGPQEEGAGELNRLLSNPLTPKIRTPTSDRSRTSSSAAMPTRTAEAVATPSPMFPTPDEEEKMRHNFSVWRDGKTGVPIVDAVMRELRATGYASNRARMITASFCTRDLGQRLPRWLLAHNFAIHLLYMSVHALLTYLLLIIIQALPMPSLLIK